MQDDLSQAVSEGMRAREIMTEALALGWSLTAVDAVRMAARNETVTEATLKAYGAYKRFAGAAEHP
jgi:hypothetical protein